MELYKLTDQNYETRNHTKWGEGVTHTADGAGDLCGPGWLHAYEDPLLAALLNPIHADIEDPILWEAEGSGEVRRDGQMKIGVTSLTTIRCIDLPSVTTEQRVEFAVRCALEVSTDPQWRGWATRWLDGTDRSEAAAREAAWEAVWAAAASASPTWASAAAQAAAWAAAAAQAAQAAAWAARAVARAAAEVAREAAWEVARAAAASAERAAAQPSVDLVAIAHRVVPQ